MYRIPDGAGLLATVPLKNPTRRVLGQNNQGWGRNGTKNAAGITAALARQRTHGCPSALPFRVIDGSRSAMRHIPTIFIQLIAEAEVCVSNRTKTQPRDL